MGITISCYLLIDFNRFLVLFQLSAVVSDLQKTFVSWAEKTQTRNFTLTSAVSFILNLPTDDWQFFYPQTVYKAYYPAVKTIRLGWVSITQWPLHHIVRVAALSWNTPPVSISQSHLYMYSYTFSPTRARTTAYILITDQVLSFFSLIRLKSDLSNSKKHNFPQIKRNKRVHNTKIPNKQ